jgi:hypothetical protein
VGVKPIDVRCTRREFIEDVTLAGVSLPLAMASGWAAAGLNDASRLENDQFAVGFEPRTGQLGVWRRDGVPLLTSVQRARRADGWKTSSDSAYRHVVDSTTLNDELGQGRQLVVRSTDSERQLDMETRVSLYDGQAAVWIDFKCRNASAGPLVLERLQPVCALPEMEGGLFWSEVTQVLTNGPMYYDPGRVIPWLDRAAKAVQSWWNVCFFKGYSREGLNCGFVDNQSGLGQVKVSAANSKTIELIADSVLAMGFELAPGHSISSGRFMIGLAPDPYLALESYAAAMGRAHQARLHSLVHGWCDWPFAFEGVTEEEVVRNAEFASRTLKPFGFEYIQIDEGFQRWHGDWEGNAKFPHGMKWLADRIRSLGLKAGLWLAPYVISDPTEVFQKHPEWLLRHPEGRLRRVGPWPNENSEWAQRENPKRYGLDITHPGAAAWLAELFDTVANQWGYEMIKIDFVDWSLLAAERYHNPNVTRAQAYRQGAEIMRKAIGPKCHLLDCGPGPVSVGMLDSMRIELDQPPVNWKQYFLESASSAPAMAKRYYFHKRAWINDADHVCLNLLTIPQAQAAASLIALSGGNLMSGDRLPDLDAGRLDILKKIFPSYGEAARPVDLFDTDRHSIFALKIQKPFGEWTVAGLFNSSETEPLVRNIPLSRLWLDEKKTYLAFDFWNQRLREEVTGELRVTIPPASVVLLALHEKRNVPQVLSTDRHVLQGAIELEQIAWNAETQTLSGVSLGPPGTAHNLAVHLPERHPWFQGGPFLFHDFAGYTVKMMDEHILRIRVRFEETARVAWRINLNEFFPKR